MLTFSVVVLMVFMINLHQLQLQVQGQCTTVGNDKQFVLMGPPGRDGRDGQPGLPGVNIQELKDLVQTFTLEALKKQNQSLFSTSCSDNSYGSVSSEMLQELRKLTEKIARDEVVNNIRNITSQTTLSAEMLNELREMMVHIARSEGINCSSSQNINIVLDQNATCPNTPTPFQRTNETCAPATPGTQPPLNNQSVTCSLGKLHSNPADSCRDVFRCDRNVKSGFYYIKTQTNTQPNHDTIIRVYCHMESDKCGIEGVMRIADVDLKNVNHSCPPGWSQIFASSKNMCVSTTAGCLSVIFPTYGIKHGQVCGMAAGYVYYYGYGFYFNSYSIDQPYITGISITSGPQNNREHVWSYATGYSEVLSSNANCPCSAVPGNRPPYYVGNNYYCDVGAHVKPKASTWYTNSTLWDSKGCYSRSRCCSSSSRQPWFQAALHDATTENIEVRLCRHSTAFNVGLEKLELYVY